MTRGASLAKHRKDLARAGRRVRPSQHEGSHASRPRHEASRAGDQKILARLTKLDPTLREKLDARTAHESAKALQELCAKVDRACMQGRPVRDPALAKDDARRALIAAAAYQERWPEVDAHAAGTGPALLGAASGLAIEGLPRLRPSPPAGEAGARRARGR